MAGPPVLSAYVDAGEISLWHRDETGRLRERRAPAEWSFFLKRGDISEDGVRQLRNAPSIRGVRVEGDWLRIEPRDENVRRALCMGDRGKPGYFAERAIATYEGDVGPVRRFLSDNDVALQKPRPVFLDFEWDSRVPFARKEEARVLCWTLADQDAWSETLVLEADSDDAEAELLGQLWERIVGFDQVLAWNGDGADFPVCWKRSQHLSLSCDVRRHHWLDHMKLFERMNKASAESGAEKRSMKLEDIGMAVVGRGKDNFDASKTWEAWNTPPCASGKCSRCRDCMARYNRNDTVLLRDIDAENGYLELFNTVAEVCRVLPDSRGLLPSMQVDGFMLRLGVERGHHFPTKEFREETEQFKGAFVMEPKTVGIARDVHVFDFASLYPSIILTWNMSTETLRDAPVNGPIPEGLARSPLTGQHFAQDVDGILPSALRRIIKLRVFWNEKKAECAPGTPEFYDADHRSSAYKIVGLTFYGVVGSSFSRYFDVRVAESVTQCGVWLIRDKVLDAAARRKMNIVYGDTDSGFVADISRTAFTDFVRECNESIIPEALRDVGCTRNHVKLEAEKGFATLVFVSAKRYVGYYAYFKGKDATADSKPEIKGLEYKRGDANLLAARLQGDIIDLLRAETRVDPYRKVVDAMMHHVLEEPLPIEEISMSKSLSKPLSAYVTKTKTDGTKAAEPAHVQVGRILKERGEQVGEGTRVQYFVTDGSKTPNVVRPIDEYGKLAADRYYLWEALIYPPAMRLLEAIFPDGDWSSGYEKVRPKGLRKKLSAPEEQLGFAIGGDGKAGGAVPFEIVVDEHEADMLEDLRRLVDRHPGPRPLVFHVRLESGAVAILRSPVCVSGSRDLVAAVDEMRFVWRAARDSWERACAGA